MKVKINVEIYSKFVTLLTTYDEYKEFVENANEDGEFVTAENNSNYIYVLVTDKWDDMQCGAFIQCLSHEMNHAAMCILGQSGVRFDYNNQEPLCYLQDFLMRKSIDAISKKLKVTK
tara:strand:+ start:135 stop:485 length:351 start_codon:yes stop_codon:yes gene_type:complete